MSSFRKGLLLAVVQLALVASLAAKFAWDRAHLPRVWAQTSAYDPELPIRGRYLAVQLAVNVAVPVMRPGAGVIPEHKIPNMFWGTLHGENGQLVATVAPDNQGVPILGRHRPNQRDQFEFVLMTPVLFFLPEHAQNPWQQAQGGEVWVEVTVPKKGPPRPIRLGVKRGENITPLDIH